MIKNEKFHHLLLWLAYGSSVYNREELLIEINYRSYPKYKLKLPVKYVKKSDRDLRIEWV